MALFQLSNRLDVKKQDSKVSTSFGENADSFFGLVPKRWQIPDYVCSTGKSLSEAFILTSTNPHFDRTLFVDLPVQYMKTTSSEHKENMLCTQIVFCFCFEIQNKICKQHVLPSPCSELGIFIYWTGNSLDNLLSY